MRLWYQRASQVLLHTPSHIHAYRHMLFLSCALLRSALSWDMLLVYLSELHLRLYEIPSWLSDRRQKNLSTCFCRWLLGSFSYCDGSGFEEDRLKASVIWSLIEIDIGFASFAFVASVYLFRHIYLTPLFFCILCSCVMFLLCLVAKSLMLVLNMSCISQEEMSSTRTHTDQAYKIVNYELAEFSPVK